MLNELYCLERKRIANMEVDKDADLQHPVFGEGNIFTPLIMFVGEAPGREEVECGRPFVGKAGKQLDSLLELAGIDRSSVFVTNAVKYRPINIKNGRVSNRTPSELELRRTAMLLRAEIDCINPYVIATLGNAPLRSVYLINDSCAPEIKIGESHGIPRELMIYEKPYRIFPLYHPAAAIYNRALRPVLEQDIIALGEYCRKIVKEEDIIV